MVSSSDVNRLFLQSLLSRRVMSQKLALKIWEKCADAVRNTNDGLQVNFSDTRDAWDMFLTTLNDTLNPLDLEIAHMHDEISGKEMIALVNRKGDELAQMATDYSPAEIAYFRAVVEQIMLAPNESYSVSSLAALREVSTPKAGNMTKTQAEVVLGSFVANGWLLKSKKGRYSLSSRTLLELLPYFKNTYQDELMECTICMEIITRGIACYTAHCKTRMHNHCFATYKRRSNVCPTCKESWGDAHVKKLLPVGEAAYKEGQDQRRRVRRRSTEEEDGDEDAEGEEDEDEDSQAQTQTQPSRTQEKRKGKKAVVKDENTDVEEEEDDSPPPTRQTRRTRR